MQPTIPKLPEFPAISDDYRRFAEALKQAGFAGDLGLSYADRLAQATDNSIYQVLPELVCYPRHRDDISLLLSLATQPEYSQVKLSPRGGGTGTNGQSLTTGAMIDLSRYMNQIVELDPNLKWVRVEPGVVLDQLNRELQSKGVFFAPDLSPSNRATLGGMVNTDACGKGSRVYGKTSQHILELDLVLSDGSFWQSVPLTAEALQVTKSRPDLIGRIHQVSDQVYQENRDLIAARFPKLTRFLTGYNLAKIYDEDGQFNLNYLISGSEGTLAFVVGMRLRLTPIPTVKRLVLAKYNSFLKGLAAARDLVSCDPAAVETVDDTILSLARQDTIWHQVAGFFSQPEDSQVTSVNLIEFIGFDAAELQTKVDSLLEKLAQDRQQSIDTGLIGFQVASSADDIAALWSLRKKGVGLLGNRPGNRRPIPFVEDTVVPPENLAAFIAEFRALLDSYGLQYGMFGHVDVGCLHVRPALDLKQQADQKLIRDISNKVRDLVLKYHGVIWGEHGKGYRGEYLPDFFGAELYERLRDIKTAFDPYNRLNPGKLVSARKQDVPIARLDQVPMRGQFDSGIADPLQQAFSAAIHCNGNGACFNFDENDVMCPSYKGRRDRIHSPKGRAGILREWLRQITGGGFSQQAIEVRKLGNGLGREGLQGYDFSHEVYEALDGCLSCKACTTQCPIKVDIPEMKSRFLSLYHSRYRRPLSDHLIRNSEQMHARMLSFGWVYNWALRLPGAQSFLAKTLGMVDPPILSRPHYRQLAGRHQLDQFHHSSWQQHPADRLVFVLPDAITAFYEAPTFIDALLSLRALGFRPVLLPFRENGKAKHVKGFLKDFVDTAEQMSEFLRKVSKYKVPVVGLDPAITLTYREEYPQYLGEAMRDIKVWMPQEFLAARLQSNTAPWLENISLHQHTDRFRWLGHCGEQTASPQAGKQWQQIYQSIGLHLQIQAVGCCGMAGGFGHESRHKQESKSIYELSWQLQVNKAKEESVILLASGASCRSQAERFDGHQIKHPLAALWPLLMS